MSVRATVGGSLPAFRRASLKEEEEWCAAKLLISFGEAKSRWELGSIDGDNEAKVLPPHAKE